MEIKEGESALADNTFWDLHNFSDDMKAEFNNIVLLFIQNNSLFKNKLKLAELDRW